MTNNDSTAFIPPVSDDDTQPIPAARDEPNGLHPAVGVLVVAAISIFGASAVFAGATAVLNQPPPPTAPIVRTTPSPEVSIIETPSASPSPRTATPKPSRTTAKPTPTPKRTTAKPPAPTRRPPATTRPPAATTPPASAGHSALELEVIRLANVARAGAGCGPVAPNAKLAAFAQAHSQKQLDEHRMHHSSGPTGFRSWGENVAWGYRTAESVHEAWMNSPGHRRNILNCSFSQIGVGYAGMYWTQVFGG